MKYARKPAQTFTPGDDQPATPCVGEPWPYDVLSDRTAGFDVRVALARAQRLCGTCLLNNPKAAKACLDGARGEQWREQLLGHELGAEEAA